MIAEETATAAASGGAHALPKSSKGKKRKRASVADATGHAASPHSITVNKASKEQSKLSNGRARKADNDRGKQPRASNVGTTCADAAQATRVKRHKTATQASTPAHTHATVPAVSAVAAVSSAGADEDSPRFTAGTRADVVSAEGDAATGRADDLQATVFVGNLPLTGGQDKLKKALKAHFCRRAAATPPWMTSAQTQCTWVCEEQQDVMW